nr:hypothetical protein BgiMline_033528 [Biomphalaria glabrata]
MWQQDKNQLDLDNNSEGESESETYCQIEFHIAKENLTVIHKADCGVQIQIVCLKNDLQTIFHLLPCEQEWYLRDRIMEDNRTLEDYGITGTSSSGRNSVQIYIRDKRKHS